MQLITDKISMDELKKMSESLFGGLVKAVVDINSLCTLLSTRPDDSGHPPKQERIAYLQKLI